MRGEIISKDKDFIIIKAKEILDLDVVDIKRMGGLTNHTYLVLASNQKKYIFRIPGEGTETLINREDERVSTKLACDLDIDAKLLYFAKDGFKITECIEEADTLSSEKMREPENLKDAALIFKKLHNCNIDTKVDFKVFDMARIYEDNINKYGVKLYEDYLKVKEQVLLIKEEIDANCKINIAPCHNDPLCENWVRGKNRLYLIDWEYAGMNDSLWDLADVSIEANYDDQLDRQFLSIYLEREPDNLVMKHFLANKIYVDYLWTLWALTRVPFDGLPMEEWALERYNRLKRNIDKYQLIPGDLL